MIDTTAGSARPENRRGRAAHITLWVLQVIGAVFMLGAAYPHGRFKIDKVGGRVASARG